MDNHQGGGQGHTCFWTQHASFLLCLCYWPSRSCGLWTGLPWEGGNTTVLVSNLDLGAFSLEVLGSVCARWGVGCVSCCGVGRASHPHREESESSDWHMWIEASFSGLHTFQDLSSTLSSGPASFLGSGDRGSCWGRKLPFLIFFILFVLTPQADICQDPPQIIFVFCTLLGSSSQDLHSCLKYWLGVTACDPLFTEAGTDIWTGEPKESFSG